MLGPDGGECWADPSDHLDTHLLQTGRKVKEAPLDSKDPQIASSWKPSPTNPPSPGTLHEGQRVGKQAAHTEPHLDCRTFPEVGVGSPTISGFTLYLPLADRGPHTPSGLWNLCHFWNHPGLNGHLSFSGCLPSSKCSCYTACLLGVIKGAKQTVLEFLKVWK